MKFEAWVIIEEGGGYFKQNGVPFMLAKQDVAAHAEYIMRPIGSDVRRIARVRVTLEQMPELACGVTPKGRTDGD